MGAGVSQGGIAMAESSRLVPIEVGACSIDIPTNPIVGLSGVDPLKGSHHSDFHRLFDLLTIPVSQQNQFRRCFQSIGYC